MSEKMIKMLKNVNLSSLRNRKSVDDLIKEAKKQGALDMLKELDLVDKRLLGTADYLKERIEKLEKGGV